MAVGPALCAYNSPFYFCMQWDWYGLDRRSGTVDGLVGRMQPLSQRFAQGYHSHLSIEIVPRNRDQNLPSPDCNSDRTVYQESISAHKIGMYS